MSFIGYLTLVLLIPDLSFLKNTVDRYQLLLREVDQDPHSVIPLYLQLESCIAKLIGYIIGKTVECKNIKHDKGLLLLVLLVQWFSSMPTVLTTGKISNQFIEFLEKRTFHPNNLK